MEIHMAGTTVLYGREGNVGVITLNRPERLNAINIDLLKDLTAQLEAAREDDEATVIVLNKASIMRSSKCGRWSKAGHYAPTFRLYSIIQTRGSGVPAKKRVYQPFQDGQNSRHP